jgi:hypothetical protein
MYELVTVKCVQFLAGKRRPRDLPLIMEGKRRFGTLRFPEGWVGVAGKRSLKSTCTRCRLTQRLKGDTDFAIIVAVALTHNASVVRAARRSKVSSGYPTGFRHQ